MRSTPHWLLWTFSLLLGVCLSVPIVHSTAVAADPAVESAYTAAFELQRANRTDAALAKYQEALRLDPNHLPSLYEIGWSWYVLSRWEEVVATWERVLEVKPDHADAARYLPEARANLELVQKARQLKDAPETGPDSVAPKAGPSIRFALGGDTMMGSTLTRSGLPKDGGVTLFAAYAEAMKAADIAFLNLEGTLLDSGASYKCKDPDSPCYAFRSPQGYAQNLADAGIDVVSTANNHHNDFGEAGRASTKAALDKVGIPYSGPIGHETILDVVGTKIGFLAFSTSPGQNDLRKIDLAKVAVGELATKTDLVVVSFHGGSEGSSSQHVLGEVETFHGENRGDVRAFAHAVVDAGADLVVGHGPHVLRGMEIYRDRLVAYSLGNFVTYGGFNLRGPLGLTGLLVADLHPDGRFAGGQFLAGKQVPPGAPILDPAGEAVAIVRALSQGDFPKSAVQIADDGTITGLPGVEADLE
jgi:hypothetical protein